MTVTCAEARDRFPGYVEESLGREERSAVRGHVAGCPACRGEASAYDPALLFSFSFSKPPSEEVSSEETARILAAVRSGIALKLAERRISPVSPRRRIGATAAAVAAAFVLASTLTTRPPLERAAPAPEASAASRGPAARMTSAFAALGPAAVVGSATSKGHVESQAEGSPFSPFAEASGPAKRKLPADATIYDWNPGGGQPRVVWIVDRSLDI